MINEEEQTGSPESKRSEALVQRCRTWCTGKAQVAKIPRDILVIGIFIIVSIFSFWLGFMAGLDIKEEGSDLPTETAPLAAGIKDDLTIGNYVASKNGTKYYLPSCAGASRISEGNKVWFATAADAVAAGYSPAANCDGI